MMVMMIMVSKQYTHGSGLHIYVMVIKVLRIVLIMLRVSKGKYMIEGFKDLQVHTFSYGMVN